MAKKAKRTERRTSPRKKTTAKKVGQTKKTTKKKSPAKKQRANAKAKSYEQAYWGWDKEPYFIDLALRLIDSFSHDVGTAAHQKGVKLLNSEVADLVARAVDHLNDENELGVLAEAIQVLNEHKRKTHEHWINLSKEEVESRKVQEQRRIIYLLKRQIEEGYRKRPPTIRELLAMFSAAGCPERGPRNARARAKEAGLKLAPIKERRPKKT